LNPLTEIDRQVFSTLKGDLGKAFMRELVETFCEDSKQQLDQLRTALEQGDAKTFTRAAHSIKSTSLTFGALAFGELARELEMLGREGNLEASFEKYQRLCDACDDLQHVLKDLCHD